MSSNADAATGKKMTQWLILILLCIGAVAVIGFVYLRQAFPEVKCTAAKHLESPDEAADCYACHLKATPKVAQDWYESKHGVMLVKCFVCHGQPDGKGSVPFAVDPDVNTTCRKCHDPSVKRMEEKYGLQPECNQCHPFHQNSLHHAAYVKPKAKKTID